MLSLNENNYHSREANMEYMSASQYKAFRKCPASAMAELAGEWSRPATTALLVGGYVDAHFSGTMDIYRAKHPELYKRDGGLKSDFEAANGIISRIEADELLSLLLSGDRQRVITGKIAGVPFKAKPDFVLSAPALAAIVSQFPDTSGALSLADAGIVDLKIMRDLQDVYDEESHSRVPFAEAWGYDVQGAIYRRLISEEIGMSECGIPFVIAAASKEAQADVAAMYIPCDKLDDAMYEIEENAPVYQLIKEGRCDPERCERCDYCRATRRLHTIVDFREVCTW